MMPKERLTMRKIHEILRLNWDCKLSHRQISQSCSVSKSTVSEYVHRAKAAGLSWLLPEGMDDEKLEHLLFPANIGRPKGSLLDTVLDFSNIRQKLQQKGMTLALLWERYKQDNPSGYQYSHFCELYRKWEKSTDVVMRQFHHAGEKLFSDFAGSTLAVTNPRTGEVEAAHVFVAALGASSYTYAEAFWSENSESWCMGHANAFLYMGGCSQIIVPDNPRAVVNKPCPYEPDIHGDFQYMASFFGCAVIPARVRKPRDKAVVEAAVKVATMWIIAALRGRTFFSLEELNRAISELLDKLNNRPFKKMPGCRRSVFESVDKPALKPLPEERYEYTRIGFTKAGLDYHIKIDDHLYSVPYQHAKQKLEYRLNPKTLEVFFKGCRIASHVRCWVPGRPSTLKEHMPSHHMKYQELHVEWTPERILKWASKVGQGTEQATQVIMNSRQHPEQGFRACLGVIRLARVWGNERVNAACQQAVNLNACSYKNIKLILENGGDQRQQQTPLSRLSIEHDNVRGSAYYNSSTEEIANANTSNLRQLTLIEIARDGSGSGITDANA